MKTRTTLLLAVFLLQLSVAAHGAEFPIGTFDAAGFIVEKGSLKMTEKDLYKYSSTIRIEKGLRKDEVICTISATLQENASSPAKQDTRRDAYLVQWTSGHEGTLVNQDATYKGDRSTFSIEGGKLVIKSWIDRTQLWETHIYVIAKTPAPDR